MQSEAKLVNLKHAELATKHALEEIGDYDSVRRFMRKCNTLGTRHQYSNGLMLYLRWLKTKDVTLSPDELVKDHLECLYGSAPTDVGRKTTHKNLLDEFVNEYMVEQEASEQTRQLRAASISMFYKRNDAALVGDFTVTRDRASAPDRPLLAEDVRTVLKALPLAARSPLLCVWQSGCEINRVLALRWAAVLDPSTMKLREERPLRLTFYGRKRHRRSYSTFLGRDALETLKLILERWPTTNGRAPTLEGLIFTGKRRLRETGQDPGWINKSFRKTALQLHAQGLVKNGDVESWHSQPPALPQDRGVPRRRQVGDRRGVARSHGRDPVALSPHGRDPP